MDNNSPSDGNNVAAIIVAVLVLVLLVLGGGYLFLSSGSSSVSHAAGPVTVSVAPFSSEDIEEVGVDLEKAKLLELGVKHSTVLVDDNLVTRLPLSEVSQSDLLLRLPSKAKTEEKPKVEAMSLSLSKDGTIYEVSLNGVVEKLSSKGVKGDYSAADIEKLNDRVKLYSSVAGEDAQVKVKADPEAKSQYVIDLLNVLGEHGITKVTFGQLDGKQDLEEKKN